MTASARALKSDLTYTYNMHLNLRVKNNGLPDTIQMILCSISYINILDIRNRK